MSDHASDQPAAERQQLIDGRERILVTSGVRQRASFSQPGIGEIRRQGERPIEEVDGRIEFLDRDVIVGQ